MVKYKVNSDQVLWSTELKYGADHKFPSFLIDAINWSSPLYKQYAMLFVQLR